MTRIVCHQLAPQIGDPAGNRAASVAAIAAAVDAGAGVVVLPELVTSGYVFESAEEAAAAAIPRTHPLFADWAAEAARGPAVVVGGFCERGDDGRVYNSAALVDGSGVLGVHRKTHPGTARSSGSRRATSPRACSTPRPAASASWSATSWRVSSGNSSS